MSGIIYINQINGNRLKKAFEDPKGDAFKYNNKSGTEG